MSLMSDALAQYDLHTTFWVVGVPLPGLGDMPLHITVLVWPSTPQAARRGIRRALDKLVSTPQFRTMLFEAYPDVFNGECVVRIQTHVRTDRGAL